MYKYIQKTIENYEHHLCLIYPIFIRVMCKVSQSLLWKLGETPWTSSCHHKKFEKIWGSKIGLAREVVTLNLGLTYPRLAWPTHPRNKLDIHFLLAQYHSWNKLILPQPPNLCLRSPNVPKCALFLWVLSLNLIF
jgi:hypothetical protein